MADLGGDVGGAAREPGLGVLLQGVAHAQGQAVQEEAEVQLQAGRPRKVVLVAHEDTDCLAPILRPQVPL